MTVFGADFAVTFMHIVLVAWLAGVAFLYGWYRKKTKWDGNVRHQPPSALQRQPVDLATVFFIAIPILFSGVLQRISNGQLMSLIIILAGIAILAYHVTKPTDVKRRNPE